MLDGKAPVIFGDDLQTRDFTYVKDVTRALQLAMKSDYHGILNYVQHTLSDTAKA